ncbi:MAG TPA: efflux transporter outer membrane subunit [Methylotenera sp.]|nr:efflux transporter outer membrane subunit [Methylotenera sp.]HPH05084.1 efflux transporter outer membrane subunit [Methylotenera sp.]HPN00448.1 efflux transporter outer membrane subunit [Methylotenera sp.]
MSKKNYHLLITLLFVALTGCSAMQKLSEKHDPQNTVNRTKIAQNWQASLPHGGNHAHLAQFWQQFDDAVLLELIEAAQNESATLASAQSRIAQARAARTQANAALLPMVDGTASASRSVQQPATSIDIGQPGQGGQSSGGEPINTAQVGAQASWELDIFGANRRAYTASQAQEKAAKAGWHEARVAVAAEVANSYFNQRFCTLQAKVLEADAISRAESLRLTEIAVGAGFSVPANSHLAKASLADAQQQLKAQLAQCNAEVKVLVALTNVNEPTLRERLQTQPFTPNPNGSLFALNEMPASVIAQRPDIYAAEADLVTAAADIQTTYASSLPKVSLNGSIGWMWLSGGGFGTTDGKTWSLGPISITFPIYHPGVKEASLAKSEAKYVESAAIYRSKVRIAVKEVEQALVNLHSTDLRRPDIETAINGYQAAFNATQTKVNAGFANLIELEEQRRILIAAQTNAINNQKLRMQSWVSLYRAAGGGWDKTALSDIGTKP